MPVIHDSEFGEIVVRAIDSSSRIALRVAPDGRLRASTPRHTPMIAVKALLKTSRNEVRQMLNDHQARHSYTINQPIGKSHNLVIQRTASSRKIELDGTKIIASLTAEDDVSHPNIQSEIRKLVLKVLRKEAKSYLPRRLKYLASTHGFNYSATRITHASSRWGSCSSAGTISLNISLMQLPFELLDYVLIHELCHTRHMNHSQDFWDEVSRAEPDYINLRNQLKKYTPNI